MGRFAAYTGKTGFVTKQDGDTFLNSLEGMDTSMARMAREIRELQQAVAAGGGTTTIVNQIVEGEGGAANLEVTISGSFETGQLVHYAGETAVLADATDAAKWANWICVSSTGSESVLALLSPEMDVLETGTGTDDSGFLYLFTGGGVTRDSEQIVASDGGPQSGFQLFQIVGYSNGLSQTVPASGYLRGAFLPTPGRTL